MSDHSWAEKMIEKAELDQDFAEGELARELREIESWVGKAREAVANGVSLPAGFDLSSHSHKVALLDADRVAAARLVREGRNFLARSAE